jgi:hypothetical protein
VRGEPGGYFAAVTALKTPRFCESNCATEASRRVYGFEIRMDRVLRGVTKSRLIIAERSRGA